MAFVSSFLGGTIRHQPWVNLKVCNAKKIPKAWRCATGIYMMAGSNDPNGERKTRASRSRKSTTSNTNSGDPSSSPAFGDAASRFMNSFASNMKDNQAVQSAVAKFTNASPQEKMVYFGGTIMGLWAVSAVVSAVLHITATLAFAALAVVTVPIVMSTVASMGMIILAATAVGGTGLLLFGGPIIAMISLAKILVPIAAGVYLVSRINPKVKSVMNVDSAQNMMAEIASKVSQVSKTIDVTATSTFTPSSKSKAGMNMNIVDDDIGSAEQLRAFDERFRTRAQRPKDITLWTSQDISEELALQGLGKFSQRFVDEHIDGKILFTLSEDDLRTELGSDLTLGERKRIMLFIQNMKDRMA
eukprot:CAMPEP_0184692252 /NCGR_PEP_ID=MMETSP0313-20130426/812_1 /TAXON_ID=2792 /ORGANISM="Porphyridium aerugineum, Strain SAG 1380-2" /LENGTH=357 /DNA_ID=CAMNT_0027150071 /DNA_START=237 /DNA_END=1310 /DNA_ORIENTATION=-